MGTKVVFRPSWVPNLGPALLLAAGTSVLIARVPVGDVLGVDGARWLYAVPMLIVLDAYVRWRGAALSAASSLSR